MTPREAKDTAVELLRSPLVRGVGIGVTLGLALAAYNGVVHDVNQLQAQSAERLPIFVNLQLAQRDMARVLSTVCDGQVRAGQLPQGTDCKVVTPPLVIPRGPGHAP